MFYKNARIFCDDFRFHHGAFEVVDGKFGAVERELCDQRVFNATQISTISCIQGQIAQLQGLTKLVIPNGSVCPGWGNVTVAPATATTT